MRKLKQLITLLLSMALLLTAMPVQAEEQTGRVYTPEMIYPTGGLPEPQIYEVKEEVPQTSKSAAGAEYSTDAEVYQLLESEVKDALLAGETQVDVRQYGIGLSFKLYALAYYSPYLGMNMNISTYFSGDQYVFLELENDMTVEETKEYFAQVDKKVDEILSVVSDDMTDLEKALAIHEYLVYNSAYDYDNLVNGTLPRESYSSAGLFMKGTGVCNAYAYGYQYLMTKLGIECYVTSSAPMNHAWNIIELNGNYYHVDCTWDDPVPDSKGKVRHNHFLVSDSAMENDLDHYAWDRTDLVCSDTAYDDAYWTNVDTQIIQMGSKSFYMAEGILYCREGNSIREIANAGIWPVWGGGGIWNAYYSGLFYENGYLYYNTYSSIMRVYVNADGSGKPEVVYRPDLSEGYVYGIYQEGDEIKYVIKQSYRDEGTVHTAPISTEIPAEGIKLDQTSATLTQGDTLQLTATVEPSNASTPLVWTSSAPEIAAVDKNGLVTALGEGNAVITVHSGNASASCSVTVEALPYVLGDVNSDGKIDISDLRLVLRYVCGKVELSQQQILAGDVVVNGKVNIEDLRLLLRYICGKVASL